MTDTDKKNDSIGTIISVVLGMAFDIFKSKLPDNPPGEPEKAGEVLRDDILARRGISPEQFSERTGVPLAELNKIFNGEARITPEHVRKFEPVIGTAAELMYYLQDGRESFEATKKWPASPSPEKIKKITAELRG